MKKNLKILKKHYTPLRCFTVNRFIFEKEETFMFIVSPSIYSADPLRLAQVLDSIKGIENLHMDIDDGNFVKGISFGVDTVKAITDYTDIPVDVHLEVINPLNYIESLCNAGIQGLCAHIEALAYPYLFLSDVKRRGVKAGLSLNLKTPVNYIQAYVKDLDYLLLVSIETDYEGLPFRSGVLEKVKEARKLLPKETPIWIDGGVNDENLEEIVLAGADAVVMGRAIFESQNPFASWKYYRDKGESYSVNKEI